MLLENVEPESLEERLRNLYNDDESGGVYELILNCVSAYLFSRFPNKREYALKSLVSSGMILMLQSIGWKKRILPRAM